MSPIAGPARSLWSDGLSQFESRLWDRSFPLLGYHESLKIYER